MTLYSTIEVCELAGCSFRKLDYWVRTGVIDPAEPGNGSGSRRLFSARNVAEARLVARLMGLRVGTGQAHDALVELLPYDLDLWAGSWMIVSPRGVVLMLAGHPASLMEGWVVDLGRCVEGLPAPVTVAA